MTRPTQTTDAAVLIERERCARIAEEELEVYCKEGGEIWVVRRILDKIRGGEDRASDELARLRSDVIAFCGPWATLYARDLGLPDGHLHPIHYDILARCGARMDAFTRSEQT